MASALKSVCVVIEKGIDASLLSKLESVLMSTYPFLQNITRTEVEPALYSHCLDKPRNQLNGDCLLDFMDDRLKEKELGLLLTQQDAYSSGLNFVFGVATKNRSCFVTLYRLDNDSDFIIKECVHELGHVFGLKHCKLPCVMTFSISVYEAHQKSSNLCKHCQELIQ
eukprot:TRINITY_DN3928_c0_g1_i1.p1 TRINITY_DN3928_c0_g1~~TRINITY_DN3928_c0_g1_i1.p1  ORF type:complete len:167 (-),score=21.26 TRINITY_DN3928_c0_g1_i1:109-609(-)